MIFCLDKFIRTSSDFSFSRYCFTLPERKLKLTLDQFEMKKIINHISNILKKKTITCKNVVILDHYRWSTQIVNKLFSFQSTFFCVMIKSLKIYPKNLSSYIKNAPMRSFTKISIV